MAELTVVDNARARCFHGGEANIPARAERAGRLEIEALGTGPSDHRTRWINTDALRTIRRSTPWIDSGRAVWWVPRSVVDASSSGLAVLRLARGYPDGP